jgi:hypothetical protein
MLNAAGTTHRQREVVLLHQSRWSDDRVAAGGHVALPIDAGEAVLAVGIVQRFR